MASNYYHDYQDYQNYSSYQDQANQNENGHESQPTSSPAPALTSPNSTSFDNRNVSFNQDNHNPNQMPIASADTTQTSYYQSQSTPSSFNSPPLVSSPTQSSNNNNPPSINTNLNRNIGTLASRETKTTEKTNGTGNSGKSTATAAVALNFWDSLVPSRWAGLYLGVILVEAVIVITMVAIVFGMIEAKVPTQSQELKTVPVYLAIFVFGMLFEVIFALDAARLKNTIQCIGVCVFNVALIITASLEISQVRDAIRNQDEASGYNFLCDPSDQNSRKVCDLSNTLYPTVEKFLIVVPVIVGLAQIPITILTWRLHTEFGWLIYKKLGADLRIRKMFLWYQVFVVLLKFCFFFGTGFSVAYLILIADRDDWGFGVTIAAIPLAIASLVLAAIAVRKEIKYLMIFSIVLFLAGLTYFAYKLSVMYNPSSEENYVHVKLTLTWFSIFSIASLLLTTINSLICFKNFGNGLKEAHEKPTQEAATTISRRRQVGRAFRGKSVTQSFNGLETLNGNGNKVVKSPILEDEEEELGYNDRRESTRLEDTNGNGNGTLMSERRESNPMGIGINSGRGNASRLSLD